MSPWSWLWLAAAAEIAWSQSIRPTEGFTRPLPTVLCLALAFAAILPLSRAMDGGLPVGTAYAVFTGIGAAGAVALGVAVSSDDFRLSSIGAIALIVAGVIALRVTSPD